MPRDVGKPSSVEVTEVITDLNRTRLIPAQINLLKENSSFLNKKTTSEVDIYLLLQEYTGDT